MNYLSLKRKKRKGFTLVELLVVIAILAVLATVSVVGYLGFTKKAKISNDISLTTQMNTILQAEEAGGETFDTPHDAVEALKNGGLDISKLTPTTNDYSYVYDLKQNRFFLLDETHTKVAPSNQEESEDKTQIYAFVGSQSETESGYWKSNNYSFYLKDNFTFTSTVSTGESSQAYKKIFGYDGALIQKELNQTGKITVNGVGIDTGNNKNVGVTFTGKVTSDIVIRTTGDQSSVSITTTKTDSSNDACVSVYGFANKVEVKEAAESTTGTSTTVNVAGSCDHLTVESGKVDIEETAIVAKATVSDDSKATVNNNGYVGEEVDSNGDKVESSNIKGNKVGGNYEISTLSQLETFRDTVNAGNTFENFNESNGKIVELTSDITLKDGWTPIGEGARRNAGLKTAESGTYFEGTFNGNNHTISNLNNKNYNPSSSSGTNRIHKDGNEDVYCYGLFALVRNATIKDLKLTNVDINQDRYNSAYIDSAAGLVGYASGECTFSGITVSGSIIARDAAGGIVGRWYGIEKNNEKNFFGSCSIENCTSNTTISATGNSSSSKGAGIIGYVGTISKGKLNIKNCNHTGNVTGDVNADHIGVASSDNNITLDKDSCTVNGNITINYTKKCVNLFNN